MMAMSMDRGGEGHVWCGRLPCRQPGVEGPGVGALGFCLGGGLVDLGGRQLPEIAAAVTYYYVMPHGKPDFSKIKGPVLGHFGTADEFIPPEGAKELESELKDAGVEVTFHFYEGAGTRSSTTPTASAPMTRARRSLVAAHGRASCARRSSLLECSRRCSPSPRRALHARAVGPRRSSAAASRGPADVSAAQVGFRATARTKPRRGAVGVERRGGLRGWARRVAWPPSAPTMRPARRRSRGALAAGRSWRAGHCWLQALPTDRS